MKFEEIESALGQAEYSDYRLSPKPGEEDYLHLSDLLLFLEKSSVLAGANLLDLGCGGSPYRTLFKTSSYSRADFVEMPGLDYIVRNDGTIPERDGAFDTVLSTQVLEHVPEPQVFLREAFRVLRPGGRLILTTHGVFPDHGCPYDFRRWTADGLSYEITQAGFAVQEVYKLTTDARAGLYISQKTMRWLSYTRRTKLGWALAVLRNWLLSDLKSTHSWADRELSRNRMVNAAEGGAPFYIALGVVATRA